MFLEHDVITHPQGKFQRVYDNTRLCLRQKLHGFWCVFGVVLCVLLCQECGFSIWVYLTCLKIHAICVCLYVRYRFSPNVQKKKLCRFPFIFFLPAPNLTRPTFDTVVRGSDKLGIRHGEFMHMVAVIFIHHSNILWLLVFNRIQIWSCFWLFHESRRDFWPDSPPYCWRYYVVVWCHCVCVRENWHAQNIHHGRCYRRSRKPG